jgi:hypothetical protein
MSISAMKQALEFIEKQNEGSSFWLVPGSNLNTVVSTLRQAIAEAEKREWVGLTDEEIMEVVDQITTYRGEYMLCVGNALEAKLKEKNT